MKYNFDEVIDRRNTNSMNVEGFREYIFHDEKRTFPFADDDFIRMWIADMEFAAPPEIIEAVKERLDQRIFGYTKIFDPGYYESFAGWCQEKYDWTCAKEELVTSPGIIPALFGLVPLLTEPDEKILILTPSYAFFKHAAAYHDRELVCSDLINEDNWYTIDFEDFAQKAADPKVRLCIFCNPHNPSGRVWTEEELKRTGQICRENDLWVISDEIHCDLLRQGVKHIPMAKAIPGDDRIITCMAPSKTFNLAGLLLSNVIIPNEDVRKKWKKRNYFMENPLSVAGVQEAYAHGAEWLDELKTYLDGNFEFLKAFLAEKLPLARFRIPEATYLGWVDISAYVSPEVDLPAFFADKAGVLLEGGDMFVRNSDCFIRLNLACPRATLETGMERIAAALQAKLP